MRSRRPSLSINGMRTKADTMTSKPKKPPILFDRPAVSLSYRGDAEGIGFLVDTRY
jgi:hypothetical protein